jgi:hypothetical protein
MKKLITICLIMATTFAMQAQKKELNKEETVAYINKIFDGKMVISMMGKTLNYERSNEKIDLNSDGVISIKHNYLEHLEKHNYFIHYDYGNIHDTLYCTSFESDASRLKKAFEHLLELLKTDDSDPFGN